MAQDETWDAWERHPAGEEVVVLLSGRVDVVQDLDGGGTVVELHPGEAMINPANVWHTARVHEPGTALVHHARPRHRAPAAAVAAARHAERDAPGRAGPAAGSPPASRMASPHGVEQPDQLVDVVARARR